MILVIFGTSHCPFNRLSKAIERYAGQTKEKIIVQKGNTPYTPKNTTCYDFIDRKKLQKLISQARIVITHGGFGAIMDCLKLKKPVVAVPRLQKSGETQDGGQGQHEIVKHLEEQGKIIGLYDISMLPEALEKASFLNIEINTNDKIPALVLDYIVRYDT